MERRQECDWAAINSLFVCARHVLWEKHTSYLYRVPLIPSSISTCVDGSKRRIVNIYEDGPSRPKAADEIEVGLGLNATYQGLRVRPTRCKHVSGGVQ